MKEITMTDTPETPAKKSVRTKAEIIVQMTKEAQRVERRLGANSCIVICFFEDQDEAANERVKNIRVQDAGRFPMPPNEFYELMIRAHEQGLMSIKPPKSRIIKPH